MCVCVSVRRYFAIQGSTSLEHWQINLQFEPVIFEDPALGVRVHRGVYMVGTVSAPCSTVNQSCRELAVLSAQRKAHLRTCSAPASASALQML